MCPSGCCWSPVEMRSGWLDYRPRGPKHAGTWIGSIRCQGLFEADAAERLGALLDRSNTIPLSTRISNWMFIATVYAPDQEQGRSVLEQVRDRLKPWSLDCDDESLSAAVGRVLTDTGASVSTAESCWWRHRWRAGRDARSAAGTTAVSHVLKQSRSPVGCSADLFQPDGPVLVSADVAKAVAQVSVIASARSGRYRCRHCGQGWFDGKAGGHGLDRHRAIRNGNTASFSGDQPRCNAGRVAGDAAAAGMYWVSHEAAICTGGRSDIDPIWDWAAISVSIRQPARRCSRHR